MARIGLLIALLAILSAPFSTVFSRSAFTGTVQRPFPTLMPLDYSTCRAQAWLLALKKAAATLPRFVDTRLRELDLDIKLGRLAIAALLHPVEVVTPDISASVNITVYLQDERPSTAEITKLLNNPEKLIFEMCLIIEIEQKIKKLHELWPSGLDTARERLKELDFYANGLHGLWDALKFNAGSQASVATLAKTAAAGGDSPILHFMEATALLDGGRPQQALDAATKAVREARRKIADSGPNKNLWRLVLAKCLYARGVAHWRLNQPALSEADFDAGAGSLKEYEHKPPIYTLLLMGRGALRGILRNVEGMCADYVEACGLGNCRGLTDARSRGLCGKDAS